MKKMTSIALVLTLFLIGCGKEKVEEVKTTITEKTETTEVTKDITTTQDTTNSVTEKTENTINDGKNIASQALEATNKLVDGTKNTISLTDDAKEVTLKTLEEGKEFSQFAGKTSNQALQVSNKVVDGTKNTISLVDDAKQVTEKTIEEGKEFGTFAANATKKVFSNDKNETSTVEVSQKTVNPSELNSSEKLENSVKPILKTNSNTVTKTTKQTTTKNITPTSKKTNSINSVSPNKSLKSNSYEKENKNLDQKIQNNSLNQMEKTKSQTSELNSIDSTSKELKFKTENNQDFSVEFVGAYAVLKTSKGEGFILNSSVSPEGVRYSDDKGHELFFPYQLNNVYLNGVSVVPTSSKF